MLTFHWVSGELTEVQRFINVPMRWCEQYPARERRELWIRSNCGLEVKLVVHARVMPARRGHQVLAVVHRKQLVGLRNLSTGAQVNFLRSDPPLLLRRCDGAWLGLLIATGLLSVTAGWLLLATASFALATVLLPAAVLTRLTLRRCISRGVDAAFDVAQQQAFGRPGLRRVK
jgi:hypothetical protein